jgi:3-hydroxy-9,10-secoandrosta-1,3,5(10)-triene-9,17-dione monooxygenase reductase component
MSGAIDNKTFRQALGAFTTGVTIVTTVDAAGAHVGMTANSFNSVSLDPPMVLWSIARSSTNFDAFVTARCFAVHVLAAEQEELATRFSKRGVDRFAGLPVSPGPEGIPLLDGCAARFQCRMAFRHEGGDHVILVGEVLALDLYEREPLVFKGGRFALAVHKPAAPAPAEEPGPAAFAPDFLVYQLGRAYYQIFHRILPEVERYSLNIAEFFTLSMLGIRDGRSLEDLDSLLSYTGTRVAERDLERLLWAGLIQRDGNRAALLTAEGRGVLMALMAAAKEACDEAERSLDPSESRLLRQLLNRVIVAGNPGLPSPWKA